MEALCSSGRFVCHTVHMAFQNRRQTSTPDHTQQSISPSPSASSIARWHRLSGAKCRRSGVLIGTVSARTAALSSCPSKIVLGLRVVCFLQNRLSCFEKFQTYFTASVSETSKNWRTHTWVFRRFRSVLRFCHQGFETQQPRRQSCSHWILIILISSSSISVILCYMTWILWMLYLWAYLSFNTFLSRVKYRDLRLIRK